MHVGGRQGEAMLEGFVGNARGETSLKGFRGKAGRLGVVLRDPAEGLGEVHPKARGIVEDAATFPGRVLIRQIRRGPRRIELVVAGI